MAHGQYLTQLDDSLIFPEPQHALSEPNGLLAIGGDLTSARMLSAYRHGIFPWYSPHQPILWWSPDPRGILWADQIHISRSLRKAIQRTHFRVSLNLAFDQVVSACAAPRSYTEETWITDELKNTYHQLHQMGIAQSVEIWDGESLVGGLYGLVIGKLFCGESMFHHADNASKMAFVALCQHLLAHDARLIDCQMQNDYLTSMGAQTCPRAYFLSQLHQLREDQFPAETWQPRELSQPWHHLLSASV